MIATVWRRRRVDGRDEPALLPTREAALLVGTAYTREYLDPEAVEADVAFAIMRQDTLDDQGPILTAIAEDLGAAIRWAARLRDEHLAEMARRHGPGFGAITEWHVEVVAVVR